MAGYWMIRSSDVVDQEAMAKYVELWTPIAEKYGAHFLAGRGVRAQTREGPDHPRSSIMAFPTYDAAVNCYDDPDYQTAMIYANKAYEFRQLVIVESVE